MILVVYSQKGTSNTRRREGCRQEKDEEATGVAKHVRVDREWHLGGIADALDESVETDVADGPAALG